MTRIVCEKHNSMRAPEHEECLQCKEERLDKRKSKKVEKVESKTITISSGSLSR